MNERIQRLYEAADAYAESRRDYNSGADAFLREYNHRQDLMEKFAELITKECALIAGLMEHEGRKNIGANILDSFGVE